MNRKDNFVRKLRATVHDREQLREDAVLLIADRVAHHEWIDIGEYEVFWIGAKKEWWIVHGQEDNIVLNKDECLHCVLSDCQGISLEDCETFISEHLKSEEAFEDLFYSSDVRCENE